jgi:hypothetical protein
MTRRRETKNARRLFTKRNCMAGLLAEEWLNADGCGMQPPLEL